jgi:aminoglycoside/choline kinase family phosphotransferase
VHIARSWEEQGVLVPKVWAWQEKMGFVLLSDFGDELLLDSLTPQSANQFYRQAMMDILPIQNTQASPSYLLPPFDENHMTTELNLLKDWFLTQLLGLDIEQDLPLLKAVDSTLIHCIQEQVQVPIHRDYHSRNLMILDDGALGIIDFQDAMIGPITYDLVSLLKDCYIQWPQDQIYAWMTYFYEQLIAANRIQNVDLATFERWFDWTGLQRHIKVLGIFSRLKIRDGKPRYLGDMPRIMKYVLDVTSKYRQFEAFDHWLRTKVVSPLQQCLARENALGENIKVA